VQKDSANSSGHGPIHRTSVYPAVLGGRLGPRRVLGPIDRAQVEHRADRGVGVLRAAVPQGERRRVHGVRHARDQPLAPQFRGTPHGLVEQRRLDLLGAGSGRDVQAELGLIQVLVQFEAVDGQAHGLGGLFVGEGGERGRLLSIAGRAPKTKPGSPEVGEARQVVTSPLLNGW
jgi:hypothetical protein